MKAAIGLYHLAGPSYRGTAADADFSIVFLAAGVKLGKVHPPSKTAASRTNFVASPGE